VDDITSADTDDVAAPGLHESSSLGDVQGLAESVGVPGGARPRREADRIDTDARGLLAPGDGVDPDVTGEPLGRTLDRRLLGQDFQVVSFVVVSRGRGPLRGPRDQRDVLIRSRVRFLAYPP